MKHTLCIITSVIVPFKFDLSKLNDLETDFILVCSTELYCSLPFHTKLHFIDIKHANEINYTSLLVIIDLILNKNNYSDFLLVSIDEVTGVNVARLREHYNIEGDHTESIMIFTNKEKMKSKLRLTDIRIPRFRLFDKESYIMNKSLYVNELISNLGLPIFCKPVESAAAADTSKIYTRTELINWCDTHLTSNSTYELDEFIEGDMFHCDSIIENGKIVNMVVSKYNIPCFQFLKGKMLGSIIIPFGTDDFKSITKFNERILKELEPPSRTVTHLEIYKKKDGELVFLEVAARPPGWLIPYIYKKSFGWDIQEIYIRLQIDKNYTFNKEVNKISTYSAYCMYPTRNGKIKKLNNIPQLDSQYYIQWNVSPEQDLTDPTEITFSALNIILWNSNYEKLKEDFLKLELFDPYILY